MNQQRNEDDEKVEERKRKNDLPLRLRHEGVEVCNRQRERERDDNR